jgi:transposase
MVDTKLSRHNAGKGVSMARKIYSPQFKDEACRLVIEQKYTIVKAAQELGLAKETLEYWLKKRGHRQASVHVPPDSDDPVILKARIRELEKSLARAQMEKDILKKATAFFANQQP